MSDYRDVEALLAEIRTRRQKLQSDRISEKKDTKATLNSCEEEPQMVRFISESIPRSTVSPESPPTPIPYEQNLPSDSTLYEQEPLSELVSGGEDDFSSSSVQTESVQEVISYRSERQSIVQSVLFQNLISFCSRYPLAVFSILLFLACAVCGFYILSEFKKFNI